MIERTRILYEIYTNVSTKPEHIINMYTKSHYLSSNKARMPIEISQPSNRVITNNSGSSNMTSIVSHLVYSVL